MLRWIIVQRAPPGTGESDGGAQDRGDHFGGVEER